MKQPSTLEQSWLNHSLSLTERLRDLPWPMQFRLIQVGFSTATEEDCLLPDVKVDERIWRRKIQWCSEETVLIEGEVALPEKNIDAHTVCFKELGNSPIGPLLFHNPNTHRKLIDIQYIPKSAFPWQRHAIFYYHEQPLLVTERFSLDFFSKVANVSL